MFTAYLVTMKQMCLLAPYLDAIKPVYLDVPKAKLETVKRLLWLAFILLGYDLPILQLTCIPSNLCTLVSHILT